MNNSNSSWRICFSSWLPALLILIVWLCCWWERVESLSITSLVSYVAQCLTIILINHIIMICHTWITISRLIWIKINSTIYHLKVNSPPTFVTNIFILSNLVYSYKWTIKLSQQMKILISLHACEAQQDYFLSQKNKSSQDIILITEGVKVTFFHLAVNIRTVTMNTQTRSYHYG